MANSSLEVGTREFTKALKRLCKAEKREQILYLKYSEKLLCLSLGRTSEHIPATGSWQDSVSVDRKWAETLSAYPNDVAITTLRIDDQGKLWARDWAISCSIEIDRHQEDDEDRKEARIWNPGEDKLVIEIAHAWLHLYTYGVEPSDIRQLLHKKHRPLLKGSAAS